MRGTEPEGEGEGTEAAGAEIDVSLAIFGGNGASGFLVFVNRLTVFSAHRMSTGQRIRER